MFNALRFSCSRIVLRYFSVEAITCSQVVPLVSVRAPLDHLTGYVDGDVLGTGR